jgi:YVTN family beta-propeller protein
MGRFVRSGFVALVVMLVGRTSVGADSALPAFVPVTIPVGNTPEGVAVNAVTNTIYVANELSNTVSVIDGATNAVTATVGVGTSPNGIAVNPTTDLIYVANNGAGTVSVIDGATDAVTATIPVGLFPEGVAVNPVTDRIYVTNGSTRVGVGSCGNSVPYTVSVIDGVSNSVTTTILVGICPFGVAVNPSTNLVYVVNEFPGAVSVVDAATNMVTASISVGGFLKPPKAVAVDAQTNTVYVTATSGEVSVINGATNTITANVVAGNGPIGVAVDPSKHTLYVADQGQSAISVINTATNTFTTNIGKVAGIVSPAAVAVNPRTNFVYVADSGSNSVTVFPAIE